MGQASPTASAEHDAARHADRAGASMRADEAGNAGPARSGGERRDPVCGMRVDPGSRHVAMHEGQRHVFCCAGCLQKFSADPRRYLDPEPVATPTDAGTVYTCPMHPQVREVARAGQIGPGACPFCGMALEPEVMTAQAPPNVELIDMTRRATVAAIVGAPVVVIEMGGHLLGLPALLTPAVANLTGLALATPVVFWAGRPFFVRGWASVRNRNLNMFTLIAMGVGVAWLYSVVATLAPAVFPAGMRAPDGSVAVYFEACVLITVLVLLGQVLELRAREQTGGAIRALLGLAPKTARRLPPQDQQHDHEHAFAPGLDQDEDIAVEAITVGDRLRVRPGEKVPVDGEVIEGRGTLDEAAVTGEPVPVVREPGAKVIGGTVNQNGTFVMRALAVGQGTLLAQIVRMVAEAQRSRAPIQRLADRVAAGFVPAVIGVAALAFLGWSLFGPQPRLAHALVAAVSVLIVACPCVLGLATPMAIMVGMGRGARAGILIKNGDALERLAAVATVVVDKTGTLTLGRPQITDVRAAAGHTEDELLALCASLELASEHPLAGAFLAAARARGLSLAKVDGFAAPTGKGVAGAVGGRRVVVGNRSFLQEQGITLPPVADAAGTTSEAAAATQGATEAAAEPLRARGATVVYAGIDGNFAGLVAVADPLKPTAAAAVRTLQDMGLRVVMLTGDSHATAAAVARQLGIEEFRAEVLPTGKAAAVEALRRAGAVVAMAGDGINDAPALAAADIGIAMGAGADIAIESAGVTLLNGDLAGIAAARKLSRATLRNIRQNLFFAFVYNAAGVPIAAGALYPLTGLTLSPVVAAAAMALSSVSVIANALRLRHAPLETPVTS